MKQNATFVRVDKNVALIVWIIVKEAEFVAKDGICACPYPSTTDLLATCVPASLFDVIIG